MADQSFDPDLQIEQSMERPSSSHIREELEALRAGTGITVGKVADKGPGLMSLPVTESHRELGGWAKSDRHIAAYEMIGCVLDRWPDLVQQSILSVTLRYSGLNRAKNPAIVSAMHPVTLTARQSLLEELLNYSRQRLAELRDRAYQCFAEELVRLSSSPCIGPSPLPDAITLVDQERYTLDEFFTALASSIQPHLRHLAAQGALKILGEYETVKRRNSDDTARGTSYEELFLEMLLERVRGVYTETYQLKRASLVHQFSEREVDVGLRVPDIISPVALLRLFPVEFENGPDLITRLTDSRDRLEHDLTTTEVIDSGTGLSLQTERIGRSVRLLLELVRQPEMKNQWRSVS